MALTQTLDRAPRWARSPRVLSLAALVTTAALAQYVFDLHYLIGVYAAVTASALVEVACYFAARSRRDSASQLARKASGEAQRQA
ncbi:hypothetical protein [Candidatus Poriferisocius sp.]|uniref:hypothetical protein n=1 Tax=Candidatus Poriferisocius sp. TaxID=3101276 RepID=UPI003B5BFA1B